MEPEVKVTKIKDRWHSRLILDGKVIDEMACSDPLDIGWISREMLRWYSKSGADSEFADAARHRQTPGPISKVWYKNALDLEKTKREGE